MRKATIFLGSALAAASLALAGPAHATPDPTPGSLDASATASAAPGSLGSGMASSAIYVQDADGHIDGARIGVGSIDGYYSHALATDGTVTQSAMYKPAL
jgi:hypothetical protein